MQLYEILKNINNNYNDYESAFSSLNKSFNKNLTYEELRIALNLDKSSNINECLSILDLNKDGKINFEDWKLSSENLPWQISYLRNQQVIMENKYQIYT